MKKFFLILIFTILNFAIFAQNTRQNIVNQLQNEGYYIVSEQIFYLNAGESDNTTKTFYAKNDYILVAYSEEKDQQITINLLDNENNLLAQSETNQLYTFLKYNSPTNIDLNIEIKNIFGEKLSKINLIILYKI